MSTQNEPTNLQDSWRHHRTHLLRLRGELLIKARHQFLRPSIPTTLSEQLRWYGNLSKDMDMIHEITMAPSRMDDGTFGVCAFTGQNIAEDDLLEAPYRRSSSEIGDPEPELFRAFQEFGTSMVA